MISNPHSGIFIVLEGTEGAGKTEQALRVGQWLQGQDGNPGVLETKEPTPEGLFGALVRFLYSPAGTDPIQRTQKIRTLMHSPAYHARKHILLAARRKPTLAFRMFESLAGRVTGGSTAELPMFLQLGMILDRYQHRLEMEIPALKQGKTVISDRDFLSTLAYGASEGIPWRKLFQWHKEILGPHFIAPNIVILLRVPVDVGLERTLRKQKNQRDRFDSRAQMSKIYRAYTRIIRSPMIREKITIREVDGTPPPEVVERAIRAELTPFLTPHV